ncbi:MAG TPA: hypothetical protein VMZ30_10850 [Pyrinomonadaceae bacterium]|nr:hypothetical protein [Pyrinomonadaceae bacterium]
MAKHSKLRPTGNGTEQRIPVVEFHVVPNGDRWDIERDDTFTGTFAYSVHVAIGLAVAAAQNDYHNGEDVMVCVQELDGHCRKVWP